jgi:hypothetical protein
MNSQDWERAHQLLLDLLVAEDLEVCMHECMYTCMWHVPVRVYVYVCVCVCVCTYIVID